MWLHINEIVQWENWNHICCHKVLFFTCLSRCRSRYAVNLVVSVVWRVLRYQRGNQNPYIEEQITQWPREKVQKDKKQSTQHTYKTKDPVTRTPLKSGVELECSGRVSNSCICRSFISRSMIWFVGVLTPLSEIFQPIRHGFTPIIVNYKKGALGSQPQVIKFTSCLPMSGGSLRVLLLPPPLKLLAMI
jgi:hypothetical protein